MQQLKHIFVKWMECWAISFNDVQTQIRTTAINVIESGLGREQSPSQEAVTLL